jgi:hypothetical protein
VLRDASELLYPAVMQAVAELGLLGSDSAAAKLAQQYARTIDQSGELGAKAYYTTLRWLGPELLKTLDALGATPQARGAARKGGNDEKPAQNALQKLRAAK